jgi:hypothetical protein
VQIGTLIEFSDIDRRISKYIVGNDDSFSVMKIEIRTSDICVIELLSFKEKRCGIMILMCDDHAEFKK